MYSNTQFPKLVSLLCSEMAISAMIREVSCNNKDQIEYDSVLPYSTFTQAKLSVTLTVCAHICGPALQVSGPLTMALRLQ